MEEQNRGIRVGKIHRKMEDSDLNEINSRTSYKKNYADKSMSKSQQGSEEIIMIIYLKKQTVFILHINIKKNVMGITQYLQEVHAIIRMKIINITMMKVFL